MLIVHLLLRDLQGQFRLTRLLQDQISLSFLIYNVFTGSNQLPIFYLQGFYRANQSPFFDLQCCCRVKSVSLFRFTVLFHGQIGLCFPFTRFLKSQTSLPFSIYKVFDSVKWVSLLRFTMLLQGQTGHSFRFTRFLQVQIGLSIYKAFTG